MLTVPKSRRLSPVVAAGLGALAGTFSCAMTVMTLPMGIAPVLGLIVAVVVFKLLSLAGSRAVGEAAAAEELAFGSTSAEPVAEPPRRTRPALNGLVAWVVCTAAGGGIAFDAARTSTDPWMHQHPVYAIGLMIGGIFGVPVAILVAVLSWFQNRQAARAATP